jgi:hypothetical protein
MSRCKSFGYLEDFSQNEQVLIAWILKCFSSKPDGGKDLVHWEQCCKVSVEAGTSCLKSGVVLKYLSSKTMYMQR